MNEKERKKLYKYAVKVGFIVPDISPDIKKDNLKLIKFYLDNGYRVVNDKKPFVIIYC